MGLYINELKDKYKDNLVVLTLPNNIGTIEGFYDSDTIDIGLKANWSNNAITGSGIDFVKGAAKSVIKKIPIMGNMASDFLGNFKSINNTVNLYEGPGEITLNFKMNIIYGVNTKDWDSIDLMINKCAQANYKANNNILLPYVYDINVLEDVALGDYGSLDKSMGLVSIGEKFTARLLKFDTLDKAYSVKLTEDGKFLYMTLTVGASTYRAVDAEELSSWIKPTR